MTNRSLTIASAFHLLPISVVALPLLVAGRAQAQSFTYSSLGSLTDAGGGIPVSSPIVDSRGDIFGTTFGVGNGNFGGLYEIVNTGTVSAPAYADGIDTLVNFTGTNGATPNGSLSFGTNGDIYGTTDFGGTSGVGNVFDYSPATNTLSNAVSFTAVDGSLPNSGVVFDSKGNIYGTAESGDFSGSIVYEVVNTGTATNPNYSSDPTALYTFSNPATGSGAGGLVVDANGNVYGVTQSSGNLSVNNGAGGGTVFEIAAGTHAFTNLITFNGTNGYQPNQLTIDSSGNLYGTTDFGGASYNGTVSGPQGTVFEIANVGSTSNPTYSGLKTLVNISTPYPQTISPVTVDSSGNLYGTTQSDGANNVGTAFEIAAGTNTMTTISTFNDLGSEAYHPSAGLAIDGNGDLIGTTVSGGANNDGVVYELTTSNPTQSTKFTWNGAGADNNVGTAGNWVGGIAPTTAGGDDLTFDGTAKLSSNFEQSYAVNSLTFAPTAGSFSLSGASLTVGAGGINVARADSGALFAMSSLVLGADQTWQVAPSSILYVSAPVTGSAALTISGPGEVQLNGANNLTGILTVNGGVTRINQGTFGEVVANANGASVILQGGSVAYARALSGCTFTMYGGELSNADESMGGTFNFYGGDLEVDVIGDPSTLNVYGGHLGGSVENEDPTQSVANFFGTGFVLSDPTQVGGFVDWTLTGTLSDGSALNIQYDVAGTNLLSAQGITFNSAAAPEPSAIALALSGLGVVLPIARRRLRATR